jgi:hypothetical protein
VPPEVKCSNQACPVVETGKCLEGFSVEKCPHATGLADTGASSPGAPEPPDPALASVEIPADSAAGKAKDDIILPKAECLDISGASRVLRFATSRTAAIVGPTSAGKTSLIASLCELFQKRPVGNFAFAASRTLIAFEQACHHARAVSGRSSPQTEHTSLGSGVGFYHLGLRNTNDAMLLHLLLSDRNGEDYRSVSDDPSNAALFVEVKRADCITMLLDGQRLLDTVARHNARHDAIMILQGLIDGGATAPSQRLAVVLTKLDAVRESSSEERTRVEEDFNRLLARMRELFGGSFGEIRAFRVAASPKTNILPSGYGVSEVLDFWMTRPMELRVEVDRLPRAPRAIGRLGKRS